MPVVLAAVRDAVAEGVLLVGAASYVRSIVRSHGHGGGHIADYVCLQSECIARNENSACKFPEARFRSVRQILLREKRDQNDSGHKEESRARIKDAGGDPIPTPACSLHINLVLLTLPQCRTTRTVAGKKRAQNKADTNSPTYPRLEEQFNANHVFGLHYILHKHEGHRQRTSRKSQNIFVPTINGFCNVLV